MSLVDDIFGPIPAPLIDQWGIPIVYIKASQSPTYNPQTGVVSGASTEIQARAMVSEITSEEKEAFSQEGTVKFLIPASYLGGYYPRVTDSIRYTQNGVSKTAKIIKPASIRGDSPIMHSVIGRLG